jgi:tellurite resistance protein
MVNKRIARLRDKLLARGTPSVLPPPLGAHPDARAFNERLRPFAEAMYLVLAADGEIGERERDVLRGALRSLSDGVLSSSAMNTMLEDFAIARTRDGVESRLDSVASALYADRADARLALGLAAASAEAEGGLAAQERQVIVALAERLGIAGGELQELLQNEDDTRS